MRRLLLPGLLMIVTLAGCSSPSVAPADEGTGPAPGTSMQQAAPVAGEGRTVVDDLVAFDGTTGTTLCADYTTPGLRCVLEREDIRAGVPVAPEDVPAIHYSERAASGLLPSSLAATWSAATPATQVLRVEALVVRSCGETCDVARVLAVATGPSPLALDMPAAELAEGERIGVRVSGTLAGQEAPKVEAYLSQPFHVEGTLTFVL